MKDHNTSECCGAPLKPVYYTVVYPGGGSSGGTAVTDYDCSQCGRRQPSDRPSLVISGRANDSGGATKCH